MISSSLRTQFQGVMLPSQPQGIATRVHFSMSFHTAHCFLRSLISENFDSSQGQIPLLGVRWKPAYLRSQYVRVGGVMRSTGRAWIPRPPQLTRIMICDVQYLIGRLCFLDLIGWPFSKWQRVQAQVFTNLRLSYISVCRGFHFIGFKLPVAISSVFLLFSISIFWRLPGSVDAVKGNRYPWIDIPNS